MKHIVTAVSESRFKKNELGNQFWQEEGWKMRADVNYYDFVLNDENITKFNE